MTTLRVEVEIGAESCITLDPFYFEHPLWKQVSTGSAPGPCMVIHLLGFCE